MYSLAYMLYIVNFYVTLLHACKCIKTILYVEVVMGKQLRQLYKLYITCNIAKYIEIVNKQCLSQHTQT